MKALPSLYLGSLRVDKTLSLILFGVYGVRQVSNRSSSRTVAATWIQSTRVFQTSSGAQLI